MMMMVILVLKNMFKSGVWKELSNMQMKEQVLNSIKI